MPTSRLAHYYKDPRVLLPKSKRPRAPKVLLKGMPQYTIENRIDQTLWWCEKEFGIGKRKQMPWILIEPKSNENEGLGWYDPDDNTICVIPQRHTTLNNLITTCIHEWCHVIQFYHNPWHKRWYDEGYDYSTHPMEVEAHLISTILMPYCVLDILK